MTLDWHVACAMHVMLGLYTKLSCDMCCDLSFICVDAECRVQTCTKKADVEQTSQSTMSSATSEICQKR